MSAPDDRTSPDRAPDEQATALPRALEDELATLRTAALSSSREAFAMAALRRATRQSEPAMPPKSHGRLGALLTFFPATALAGALAVVVLLRGGGPLAIDVTREAHVDLSGSEVAWTDIDLATHHHGIAEPSFTIALPQGARMQYASAEGALVHHECLEPTCEHAVPAGSDADFGSLQVAIPGPGSWPVQVVHASGNAVVHEQWTLHGQVSEL